MASALQVLKDVKTYLRSRKVRNAELAEIFGYRSNQAVTNLLNGTRFFTGPQAKALCLKYPDLSYEYLTKGERTLFEKKILPDIVTVSGKSKDMYNKYMSYVFKRLTETMQDEVAITIFCELIRLANILNMAEEQKMSESEMEVMFKQTKIVIDSSLNDLGLKVELRKLHNDITAK